MHPLHLLLFLFLEVNNKVQNSYNNNNNYKNYKRTGQAGEAKSDQRLMQRAGVSYPAALLSRHAAFEEQIAAETRLRAPGAVCRPEMGFLGGGPRANPSSAPRGRTCQESL